MTEKLMIATPAYGGMLTAPYARSSLVTMEELTRAGIPNDWQIPQDNDSLIHRARMKIAKIFLDRKDFSHLLWIDADIEYSANDVAALWNICAEGADIACGVYAMKKRDKQWFAAWKDGALVKNLDDWKGPTPVDYAGTGFLMLSRKAVEGVYDLLLKRAERAEEICQRLADMTDIPAADFAMIQRAMVSHYAPHWSDDDQQDIPALFMTPITDGGLESEDYFFCRIAREAGFEIIMDPKVRLGHWGQYRYGA